MLTTTDPENVNAAFLLMRYPFGYCLKDANVEKFVSPHYEGNPGLERAVFVLTSLQKDISRRLPSDQAAWQVAQKLSNKTSGAAALSTFCDDPDLTPQVLRLLEANLSSATSVALHNARVVAPTECRDEDLRALIQCVWLSSHIALCLLGIARVQLLGSTVRFEAANDAVRVSLRRAWFGVAFDACSRIVDDMRLDCLCRTNQHTSLLFETFRYFTKAWRLGCPEASGDESSAEGADPRSSGEEKKFVGAVMRHRADVLIPSMKLLVGSAVYAGLGKEMGRREAQQNGCVEDFDLMVQKMESLPVSMRPFEVNQRGLRPGALQPSIGLLSVAEMIARHKLGDHWHAALGNEMADYLASRLEKVEGVRVIRKELLRDRATDPTAPLDVDLFVVDERIGRAYAIQCKHLEGSNGIDLLDWLERFRRTHDAKRTGLDKAIQQLERLKGLCSGDEKIRRYLAEEIRLSDPEIQSICPVVVHNVWNIDFWRNDVGVCLYDLHTFCNVMDRRAGATSLITAQAVEDTGVLRGDDPVDLADPDAVISAYLNDPSPHWKALTQFDCVAGVHRTATFGDTAIIAVGLGI